jgi:hypothetical protein
VTGLIRIVRGNPDDTELAALIAVLLAARPPRPGTARHPARPGTLTPRRNPLHLTPLLEFPMTPPDCRGRLGDGSTHE